MRTVMIATLACAAFGLAHGHRDHAHEFQGHLYEDHKHHDHGEKQKPQGHDGQQEPAQAEEPLCSRMLKQMVAQEVDDDYLPDCYDDGTFVARQCFGEDCFCVDPLTGEASTDLTACPEDDDQEGSDQGSEGSDQGSEGSDQGSEGSDQGSEGSDQGSEGSDQGSEGSDQGSEGSDQDSGVVDQDTEVVDQDTNDNDEEETEEAVVSACFEEHQDAVDAGLLGNFIPQCMEDGSYAPMQCHGSTGECWCVDTLTGDQQDVELAECATCTLMRKEMMAQDVADNFLPECIADGTFAARQCFGEDCFCCDRYSGKLSTDLTACPVEEATEDNEETTEDNEEATEAAEQEENAQGSDDSEQTNEQGSESAQAEEPLCSRMLKQMVAQEVDDALLPDCNDDGTFVARQCFGENCFCVDPLTGEASTDLTACPVEETTEDNEEATEEQVIGDDIATDDEDDEDEDEDEGFSMGPSAAGAAILGVAMVGIASFVVVKRRSQDPEASESEDNQAAPLNL